MPHQRHRAPVDISDDEDWDFAAADRARKAKGKKTHLAKDDCYSDDEYEDRSASGGRNLRDGMQSTSRFFTTTTKCLTQLCSAAAH